MEVSRHCFLLPFGSFSIVLFVQKKYLNLFSLSTPFWEFHSFLPFPNLVQVYSMLSTPFWEFHLFAFLVGRSEKTIYLSTPFWEFPATVYNCGITLAAITLFLLPFGSFWLSTYIMLGKKVGSKLLSTPFWEFPP